MAEKWRSILKRIDDYRWEIPKSYKQGMRVPGLIFASEAMLNNIWEEKAAEQVANVAFLPGIVNHSLAMPDIHWGYGFAIGGVAGTRVQDGVVSPGGVGFDINCGVRLLRTNLTEADVRPKLERLVGELFNGVPSGVGSSGRVKVSEKELDEVIVKGSRWAVENGFGDPEDIPVTEASGCITGADPEKISKKAKQRGIPQLGTLGSGNHFLEVGMVDEIYDRNAARVMGISETKQVV
ncbi:MAG TPA: RtcB family protein, partial [Dehalococcoidales bacterium]|nr:RtcB family protein [Dehalococcoidales bacterium]